MILSSRVKLLVPLLPIALLAPVASAQAQQRNPSRARKQSASQSQSQRPNQTQATSDPQDQSPGLEQSPTQTQIQQGQEKAKLAHPIPALNAPAKGVEVHKLTLEEATERGIHEATAVLKAHNNTDATGEQLIQSYAQFLPNLVATGGYNVVQGSNYFTTTTPTLINTRNRGGSYQLSSTLNIFNGFYDVANLKASLARKNASDLTFTRAKQLIALDIAQSFLQVILDRDLVTIAEKNLTSSKAREDQLTEQTRIGAKNMADLFRQQAQTSSDETYLANAQDRQRNDELILLRKLRIDPSESYDFVEPTTDLDVQRDNVKNGKSAPKVQNSHLDNEAEMIRIALDKRADFHAQSEVEKALRWDTRAARSTYFPKLDFGLSMGAIGRTLDSQTVNGADVTNTPLPSVNSQLANQVMYSVGVTLTWNIFDRWVTEANVERAKVAARNSSLDTQDSRNQVVGEVRQAYGDYRLVIQQVESGQKGLIAAQKAYETVEARYQVGSANFVDLTTAQVVLVQAEAANVQAEISYLLQGRILETVMGTAAVD